MFQAVAEWFTTQTEAVRLALIALISAFGAGLFGVVKEWRKPVLAAQSVATTATAPRSADDPILLLLNEVSAMNVNLAALLSLTTTAEADQEDRIDKVIKHIQELTNELYLLRNSLNNRSIGM